MTNNELKKAVKKWADKISRHEAIKRLMDADISVALSQKLVAGKYDRELSFGRAQAIIKVLAEDGVTLAGKAS